MTQEERNLLFKDLCARLPYGVKIELMPITRGKCTTLTPIILYDYYISDDVNYLPYLFPLSSMTDEQKKEYNRCKHDVPVYHYEYGDVVEEIELFDSPESFEYLIENHFDYRGLIEKGLALDATGLNIY